MMNYLKAEIQYKQKWGNIFALKAAESPQFTPRKMKEY